MQTLKKLTNFILLKLADSVQEIQERKNSRSNTEKVETIQGTNVINNLHEMPKLILVIHPG